MAPFRFKLETVLKLRRIEEDRHKRIVADRLRCIEGLKRRRRDYSQQIAHGYDDLHHQGSNAFIDVQVLTRSRYWVSHLQRSVLDVEKEITQQRQCLVDERQALVQASKDVKAIEKLKERARQRYQDDVRRAELVEADEIAAHYHRRMQARGVEQRST